MTSRFWILLALTIGTSAFAAEPDCVYSGQVTLAADEPVECGGNIYVEPRTHIITKDNYVQFITPGTATFGKPGEGVVIECATEGDAGPFAECGDVQITASTLDGELTVKTNAPGRRFGRIDISTGTYSGAYNQDLEAGRNKKGERVGILINRNGKDTSVVDASFRQVE